MRICHTPIQTNGKSKTAKNTTVNSAASIRVVNATDKTNYINSDSLKKNDSRKPKSKKNISSLRNRRKALLPNSEQMAILIKFNTNHC